MTDTPQKRGRAWEAQFAKSVGGSAVKMSGAGFYKLDVRGSSVLWSLKYTERSSATISNDLFDEALAAIHAPGGIGGHVVPGLALNIQGKEYVVMRKADALHFMTSEAESIVDRPANGRSTGYHSTNRSERQRPS